MQATANDRARAGQCVGVLVVDEEAALFSDCEVMTLGPQNDPAHADAAAQYQAFASINQSASGYTKTGIG